MFPARQRLDAIEPDRDVAVLRGNIESKLLGRIVEIADQRQVGDGWPRAQNERSGREPLIDDGEVAVDAALEESEHGWIARWLGEVAQESIGTEKAVDLLIIEDDPAQRLELLVIAVRSEFSGFFGEIGEDHTGLAELSASMRQHRRLTHLVDVGAVLRRALLAFAKEVDEHRLPLGTDEIEHQRSPIGVSRLCKA